MNKIPRILFIKRDSGGCGFYRCVQPANFIKRMGLADITHKFRHELTPQELISYDLVIMQEMGSVESMQLVNLMEENKIPFLAEFDDFVQHISPHNLGGYPAWNPSNLFLFRAMELAKRANGITVSTNQLAREYFPYNNTIYVVPNYLDKEKWDNPINKRADGKIRIGWAGGNAHADDLKMISLVLDKIVKEYKGKVVFETMGMTRQELAGVFPMKIFNETCPSCGYEGELHHYPGEGLDEYSLVLSSKGWDIAVAPLINNSFNNCKSDIKIKEYSAIGAAIVASSAVPYKEAAQNNAQIIFADSFSEWYNALKELIEDKQKREKMIELNREWISKYWIQENADKIFEVYRQVLLKAGLLKK